MDSNKGKKNEVNAHGKLSKGKAWGKTEQAREFAHSLYEKRGYVFGNELKVWLEADKSSKKGREPLEE